MRSEREARKALVGRAIKLARVALGLTLLDVSVSTGLGESHLCRVERCQASLRPEEARRVARAIGLRPADLFLEHEEGAEGELEKADAK